MDAATDAKAEVENAQREAARKREESGMKHVPRFFEINKKGQWVPKIVDTVPADPQAAVKYVQEWIWPGRSTAPATPTQSKVVPPPNAAPATNEAPGAVSSTSG